jgi:hypothetical protein
MNTQKKSGKRRNNSNYEIKINESYIVLSLHHIRWTCINFYTTPYVDCMRYKGVK